MARRSTGRSPSVLVIAAALLMIASLPPVASAASITLTAQADATVLAGSPTTNRGTLASLRVRNSSTMSYLRFDVPELAPGETVTRASLQVYARGGSQCIAGVQIQRSANDTWAETTITWRNRPGTTGPILATRTWSSQGYQSFDVSPAVTEGRPVSFVLHHAAGCAAGVDATFQAREAASQPPLLIVSTTGGTAAHPCSDGADNDGDGHTDFPADPGCIDASDDDETDPSGQRPNILIVMTDDQRASSDGLSVMDDLRRIFGEHGTYYPNAVATTPLCCPSRASTFSGRYAHNTGVIDNDGNPLDQTTTLQYHLQQRLGYQTALVGKYLNEFTGSPPFFDLVDRRIGYGDPTSRDYGTTYVADQATTFLEAFEQEDGRPWLLFVTPFAPHEPATPEAKYRSASVPPWVDNPARSEADLGDKPPYVLAEQAPLGRIQAMRERMIRTLYSVDDLVASTFSRLDALGETNTLAFFLSDNGYQWYEHGLDKKGKPYDDSVRIPFFIRWPGHIETGLVDEKIVANIDIAPTVYDALDYVPSNYAPDGRSIFNSERSVILTEGFGRGFRSLWNPRWMYVAYDGGFREYYGPSDPWQLENRFATGSPPANATDLQAQLQAYRDCAGATCP